MVLDVVMMLYNMFDDDIFEGDNLNCTKYKVILHFGCATLMEFAF